MFGRCAIKWFKHISDSLDDPFVFELIDKFGGDGYLTFFGTLEIMSREFNIKSPGTCSVPYRFLTKKLQLSRQKVTKILKFCDERGRIFVNENGNDIQLKCPKLEKLCDEWTQRQLPKNSGVTRKKLPPKEVEVRSKKEKKNKPIPIKIPLWLNQQTWDDFLEHRKKLKSPMTDIAQKRAIASLEKLNNEGCKPEDVINQSIINGWKGLFPIKDVGFAKQQYGESDTLPSWDENPMCEECGKVRAHSNEKGPWLCLNCMAK